MRAEAFFGLTVAAVFLAGCRPQTPPDLILYNGRIFLATSADTFAEAIAIRGDRIAAVGSSAAIRQLGATRVIDLQGRTVIPGVNDAHFHFSPDPKGFRLPFRSMEPSWAEVADAIRLGVKDAHRGTWIFGSVGQAVVLDPKITRDALDRIAPAHPVLLRAHYGHGYILNSKAIAAAGIAEDEPDPAGGRYERVSTSSRRINGRLWEYAQWKPERALQAQVTEDEAIAALRAMSKDAVGFGITSMQVMPAMPVDRFARLLVKADLPIRIRAIPFSQTTAQGRDLSEIRMIPSLQFPQAKVTVNGIKWILDGTPLEQGAALRHDYPARRGWTGTLNFPEPEIVSMVQESLNFKQQLLLHTAGDRSAEAILRAMEAQPSVDWKSKRVRFEHGDGVFRDLIPRTRALGVIVVQNPMHFSLAERTNWAPGMQSMRSLVEGGIPLAIGSDGPLNPFLNVMAAVTHPGNAKEGISVGIALRAYTFGSAFAEFAEDDKGTLAPGKLADLAVLSSDPFTSPVPALPGIGSVLTLVGGRFVHDAGVLK